MLISCIFTICLIFNSEQCAQNYVNHDNDGTSFTNASNTVWNLLNKINTSDLPLICKTAEVDVLSSSIQNMHKYVSFVSALILSILRMLYSPLEPVKWVVLAVLLRSVPFAWYHMTLANGYPADWQINSVSVCSLVLRVLMSL